MGETELKIQAPNKRFEEIKKVDEETVEFWTARDLMPVLGYSNWQNFEEVIKKAMKACLNSGQTIKNHFTDVSKIVPLSQKTFRRIDDWKLDRYACYLIAQNGDPKKQQIALAQTYFAVQTRRQEIFENSSEAEKRLFIRGEVTTHNKQLFATAKQAGVNNFGRFNNAGYEGLYNMKKDQIQKKKNIGKDDVLDRAGATELAANLFRITQTDEKIRNENIKGDYKASNTHFEVGRKVRHTIKEIGGTVYPKITKITKGLLKEF